MVHPLVFTVWLKSGSELQLVFLQTFKSNRLRHLNKQNWFRGVICQPNNVSSSYIVIQLRCNCSNSQSMFPAMPEMWADWLTNWLTDWLDPWSRVFLEKPIMTQLDKKFPAIYGTLRFVTFFIRARHWSLSWSRLIQSASNIFLLDPF
jgi:hypothetical protein